MSGYQLSLNATECIPKVQQFNQNDIIITNTFLICALINAICSSILKNPSNSFWGLFNLLKNLYYFIFINMNIPSNFDNFLHFFIFIMFPLPNISELFYDWGDTKLNWGELPSQIPPTKFENQNFSTLFLITGFSIEIYLIIALIFTLLVGYINNFMKKKYGYIKFMQSFQEGITWNFATRYILQNIGALSMSVSLQFCTIDFNNYIFLLSYVIAIMTELMILGSPFLIIYSIMKVRNNIIHNHKFISSFKPLFEEYTSEKSRVAKCFSAVILIREALLPACIVLLYYYPFWNLSALILQSFGISFLVYKYQPYRSRRSHFLMLGEGIVFIIISSVLMMLYWSSFDESTRNGFGIFLIIVATGIISANLLNCIYDLLLNLWNFTKKKKKILKLKRPTFIQ